MHLHAPSVFGLVGRQHRAETLKFLADLRRLSSGNMVRKVCIDFSETTAMQAAGTILFQAELVSIIECLDGNDRPIISCMLPGDKVVAQVLKHLGLLDLLGSKAQVPVSAENVKHWRHQSSNIVEGEKAAPIIEQYRELFPQGQSRLLYEGLVEAMTNSGQHAYKEGRFSEGALTPLDRRSGARRKWWMFSQHRDNNLTIVVCDLGMGIARNLLTSPKWSMRRVLDVAASKIPLVRHKDAQLIKAAMKLGRSSTDRPNQGKGLHDMKEVIDSQGAGVLRILSGKGEYLYRGGQGQEQVQDFPTSIFGTIVEWSIPLTPGAEP